MGEMDGCHLFVTFLFQLVREMLCLFGKDTEFQNAIWLCKHT